MTFGVELLFSVLFFVWALVLTFFFLKFYLYYKRIVKNTKKDNLAEILDDLFKKEQRLVAGVKVLEERSKRIEHNSQFYIQKIGLLRFNPFNDTGGDQSFILALVDAENTGVVISSLHTRTGTRWYAKKVLKAKGVEHKLSVEEEKAIKKATRLTR